MCDTSRLRYLLLINRKDIARVFRWRGGEGDVCVLLFQTPCKHDLFVGCSPITLNRKKLALNDPSYSKREVKTEFEK